MGVKDTVPLVRRLPVDPTRQPETKGRPELCQRVGCTSKATRGHLHVATLPTCGRHWRTKLEHFHIMGQGVVEATGSFTQMHTTGISQRWANLRTRAETTAPVIVDAVNWCKDCGEPIRKRYTYCQACSRNHESDALDTPFPPDDARVVVTSGKRAPVRYFHAAHQLSQVLVTAACAGLRWGTYPMNQLVTAKHARELGLLFCPGCERKVKIGMR